MFIIDYDINGRYAAYHYDGKVVGDMAFLGDSVSEVKNNIAFSYQNVVVHLSDNALLLHSLDKTILGYTHNAIFDAWLCSPAAPDPVFYPKNEGLE